MVLEVSSSLENVLDPLDPAMVNQPSDEGSDPIEVTQSSDEGKFHIHYYKQMFRRFY